MTPSDPSPSTRDDAVRPTSDTDRLWSRLFLAPHDAEGNTHFGIFRLWKDDDLWVVWDRGNNAMSSANVLDCMRWIEKMEQAVPETYATEMESGGRPVTNCGHVGGDGLCEHPKNTTPECHIHICPMVDDPSIEEFVDEPEKATWKQIAKMASELMERRGLAPAPPSEERPTQTGAELIAAERERQIESERFGNDHDDCHGSGELVAAAVCYAQQATAWILPGAAPEKWPWEPRWWKPSDRIRNLTKAGALVAAEIDRLQRSASEERPSPQCEEPPDESPISGPCTGCGGPHWWPDCPNYDPKTGLISPPPFSPIITQKILDDAEESIVIGSTKDACDAIWGVTKLLAGQSAQRPPEPTKGSGLTVESRCYVDTEYPKVATLKFDDGSTARISAADSSEWRVEIIRRVIREAVAAQQPPVTPGMPVTMTLSDGKEVAVSTPRVTPAMMRNPDFTGTAVVPPSQIHSFPDDFVCGADGDESQARANVDRLGREVEQWKETARVATVNRDYWKEAAERYEKQNGDDGIRLRERDVEIERLQARVKELEARPRVDAAKLKHALDVAYDTSRFDEGWIAAREKLVASCLVSERPTRVDEKKLREALDAWAFWYTHRRSGCGVESQNAKRDELVASCLVADDTRREIDILKARASKWEGLADKLSETVKQLTAQLSALKREHGTVKSESFGRLVVRDSALEMSGKLREILKEARDLLATDRQAWGSAQPGSTISRIAELLKMPGESREAEAGEGTGGG